LAFKDGGAAAAAARQTGEKPGSVERPLQQHARPRRRDRERAAGEDDAQTDPAQWFRRADLAFQRAVRRAMAQGLEHPPMVGVFKDVRPLDAPRLFDPVPHSSGCTSPALECAELMSIERLSTAPTGDHRES
jgi:hypothetical protein